MTNYRNLKEWNETKKTWIWSIWQVDNSKLAEQIALFAKNPDLIIGDSQHLLIKDKKWNIN